LRFLLYIFIFPSECHLSLIFSSPLPPTSLYTLSLHDALPIFHGLGGDEVHALPGQEVQPVAVGLVVGHLKLAAAGAEADHGLEQDRKSTRLNSSHVSISYAVFCLKKKK